MQALTADLWMKSLAEAQKHRKDDPGMTMVELAEHAGVSPRTMLSWVKSAHLKGHVLVGKRQTTSLRGCPAWTPVYTILPNPGAGAAGKKAVKKKAAKS